MSGLDDLRAILNRLTRASDQFARDGNMKFSRKLSDAASYVAGAINVLERDETRSPIAPPPAKEKTT